MTKVHVRLLAAVLSGLLMLPALAAAQGFGDPTGKAKDIRPQDVVNWAAFEATEDAQGRVTVMARMTVKSDWKVYASNLSFIGPPGFTVQSVTPPPAKKFMDPISNKEVDVYEGGEFQVTFTGAPAWSEPRFPFAAKYVGCTNVICLFPYTESLDLPFLKAAAATDPVAPSASALSKIPGAVAKAGTAEPGASTMPAVTESDDLETKLARQLSAGGLSFGMLLLIVFAGGLLSNLTPCVYPMIPITLRVLARQGPSPYLSASFYSLGIVVTYSALGLVAALSGGLFGSLMASKTFNVFFAVMMIVLGVTMLGFGNFSRLQMLGNRLGTGAPSPKNAFLMGTGAGLVAAPCTGPILAALLAYTAKNDAGLAVSTALLFTFSVGFGLPYIFLGGAAAKVSAVKVPHHVQIAVKLVFASVMFGLGLYYLRIPLYGAVETLRPHWEPIALTGLALGVLLSALWVVIPGLQNNKLSMILPAAVLGVGIFAGSQWATSSIGGAKANLTWHKTEAEAYAAAAREGKPVLIDMWAEWCEACKKMDGTTFADAAVVDALARGWVVLKLDLTESTEANDAIQQKYGVQSLPTLVLMPADGKLEAKQAIVGYVNAQALMTGLAQFLKPAE